MTPNMIKTRLREIRKLAVAGDYEAAHSKRDDLYEAVLQEIAEPEIETPENFATSLAREVLKAKAIKIEEHYA